MNEERGYSEIILYQTEDGTTKIEVRLEDETVWLSQAQMVELFQTTKQNISLHITNIFAEGELDEESVVKEYLTTAKDGKSYKTNFYNLDVIISVGYRVKSHRGTQFRIWATQRLREYIIKGFTMNDELHYFVDLLRHFEDLSVGWKLLQCSGRLLQCPGELLRNREILPTNAGALPRNDENLLRNGDYLLQGSRLNL